MIPQDPRGEVVVTLTLLKKCLYKDDKTDRRGSRLKAGVLRLVDHTHPAAAAGRGSEGRLGGGTRLALLTPLFHLSHSPSLN